MVSASGHHLDLPKAGCLFMSSLLLPSVPVFPFKISRADSHLIDSLLDIIFFVLHHLRIYCSPVSHSFHEPMVFSNCYTFDHKSLDIISGIYDIRFFPIHSLVNNDSPNVNYVSNEDKR